MGVFSWLCPGCGHPLLMRGVTNYINKWMNDAVGITKDGDIHTGAYDGYGNIGGADMLLYDPDFTPWHKACWKKAGSPMVFTAPAEHAPDQGYFFDDPDHDLREPR